jgi:hypothetical protein
MVLISKAVRSLARHPVFQPGADLIFSHLLSPWATRHDTTSPASRAATFQTTAPVFSKRCGTRFSFEGEGGDRRFTVAFC